jgi:uncharacterized iron-regulated membrane protein
MRKLILNLHLYTALVAGLFIVILGVTGSVMAFEPELDHLFNPALFKVQPGPSPVPVTEIIHTLKTAYPHQKFGGLNLPSAPDMSYSASTRGKEIFINGYTGKIIGTRSLPTVLGQIHQIHLRLLVPKVIGGNIIAAASLILIWLIFSGIYLWWPLKRVTVKFGGSLRRVAFDLHSATGIYSAVFLLVLAVTGIFVHFDDALEVNLNKMADVRGPLRSAQSVTPNDGKPITPDQVLQTAQAALPGTKPNILLFPAGAKGSYKVMMHYPEDLTGNRSWALVDQYSGKLLFVESSRTAAFGTKAIIENRAIHTGQIYGYWTKFLMSLASLMLVIQVITGYYMWWKKLRSVKAREAKSEPMRETLA